MESGIIPPPPSSSSEIQSISCGLAVESLPPAPTSSSTMTSASSSTMTASPLTTSLAMEVTSNESPDFVQAQSSSSSLALVNTSLSSPVSINPPSSSPVLTSSTLTFASSSSMNSTAVSSDVKNTISELQSSIVSETNITLVSSHPEECNVTFSQQTLSLENGMQEPPKFVATLGAWAKPLLFKHPATPSEPSTPRDYDPAIVGNQLAALWPSLNDEILNKKPKSSHQTRTLQLPVEKLPPPELNADGKVRFPWAARLSAQSRNLYRAATPTYRLDGTPQISIPSKVLKLGPENKDEYIIGKDPKTAKSSPTANPMKPKVKANLPISTAESDTVVTQGFDQETCNTLSGIQSPSSHSQHEEPANTLISVTIPSPLVDSQSTPTHSQIMETSPSNITNNAVLGSSDVGAFVTSPVHCAFESPSHFTVLGDVDEDEIEPSTNLGFF
ncbi:hypothetical protein HID58_065646 [Brassica napus]|uniref:Uncharacterized protein n=1 Tax=Brassica napus TaxID=3708 RepID=A0ABQ7ZDG8_BRANA|nr:hypothetical protein HID58_065646 [Brassica napus]